MPMPVSVGPGRTITARTPVPSSSICSAVTKPFEPPLGGHVGGHARPGVRHHVGGDEDQVTPPALHHSGAEGPHQPLGPADVDPEHLLEVLRAGLEASPG